jgi:hypothetical protein
VGVKANEVPFSSPLMTPFTSWPSRLTTPQPSLVATGASPCLKAKALLYLDICQTAEARWYDFVTKRIYVAPGLAFLDRQETL